MKAECPNCGAVYQIDDSKIPDKGAYATCAKCRTRFHIKNAKAQHGESRQETITCPKCGHINISSEICSNCGIVFSNYYKAQRKAEEGAKRQMMMVKCVACGKTISESANFCPHCGEPLTTRESVPREKEEGYDEEEKAQIKPKRIALGTIIGIGIFVVLVTFLITGNYIINTITGHKLTESKPKSKKVLEKVANSAWDGSVYQVKNYLKRNLKDPSSFDAIEWSPVAKRSDGGYQVRCKYRAKNSFGGYVISNQVFVMDSNGNVISVSDY